MGAAANPDIRKAAAVPKTGIQGRNRAHLTQPVIQTATYETCRQTAVWAGKRYLPRTTLSGRSPPKHARR